MNIENMNIEWLKPYVVSYGGKLLIAIIVLLVGLKLIKYILKILKKVFEKGAVDKSLYTFLVSATKMSLYIVLAVIIASTLGADMTSFIAVLGSAGLAIGLALQGSLSNLAGGVIVLFLKPYRVGDYIDGAGHSGEVEEIQIFYTVLNTPDNKRIFIPNGELANGSITNYSILKTRRVDLVFSVGYKESIDKVKEILLEIVNKHELILDEPEPQVYLIEHAASSINFSLRVWCSTENYWTVKFDLMEAVKLEFDKQNIEIPYPQMDIHFIPKEGGKNLL